MKKNMQREKGLAILTVISSSCEVAVRVAVAADMKPRKVVRDGACKAIFALIENTTVPFTALLSLRIVLIAVDEAFASQNGGSEDNRKHGDDSVELHGVSSK